MEIDAKVYAIADNETLLKQAYDILTEETAHRFFYPEILEPCTVLPITKPWYAITFRDEPTGSPEDWLTKLWACGQILRKNGAVVIEFRSPDHPDDYLEYAYTTSSGSSGCGTRAAINAYDRALGNHDVSLVLYELFAERTAQDRARISRIREKKEAARREKGDFEITADGVLKKYRGNDTDVIIPDGVREIADTAFVDLKGVERMLLEDEEYDAPPMETLTIPDSVEKIGSYAFAYCQNLTTVHMPDSVKTIGSRAFEGCDILKHVRLSGSLTELEEYTFFLCFELTAITLPESLTRIGTGAFSGCSLKRISLPESLVAIEKEAFSGCDFKKVRIPKGVTEIGKDAFPKGTEVIR